MNRADGLSSFDQPYSLTPTFTLKTVPVDISLFTDRGLDKCRKYIDKGWMHEDFTPNWVHDEVKYNNYRRTVFGPTFGPFEQDMPGPGANEARVAISRLNQLRNPDVPGFSSMLRENQSRCGQKYRHVFHRFGRQLHGTLEVLGLYKTYDESYPEWLYQPHAKRKLRISVSMEAAEIGHDYSHDKKSVSFKLKKDELLPPGKVRGIGDLGSLRTNASAHVMGAIKEAWREPFSHKSAVLEYIKGPVRETLSSAFEKLCAVPLGRMYMCYHSDDSCVSGGCKDGTVYFNADIKACDGSHFDAIINRLHVLLSVGPAKKLSVFAPTLDRAFSYLKAPLKMRDPNSHRKVQYLYSSARLYSGSTLTTILNNFANLSIGICFAERCPHPEVLTKAEFMSQFVLAAQDAGYWVKVIPCECPEELQFLKHSPSIVSGVYEPWVNLGAYIKNFGHCPQDVPGRGTLNQRASLYVSEIVRSRENWGNHEFGDAFQHLVLARRGITDSAAYRGAVIEKSIGVCQARVPLESLARRYGCRVDELCELCECIRASGLNSHIHLPVVNCILTKDYG